MMASTIYDNLFRSKEENRRDPLVAKAPLPDRLESSRLLLRRPTQQDVDQMFRICGDPQTNLYNPAGPYLDIKKAETVMQAWLQHWEHKGFGQWTIANKDQPQHLLGFGGLALLSYGDVARINLGFRFGTDAWGRGYATEMASKALDLAFGLLGFAEVAAKVRPDNLPSITVLDRIGMQRDGSLDDVPGKAHSLVYVKRRDSQNSQDRAAP